MNQIFSSIFKKNEFIDTIEKTLPKFFNFTLEEQDALKYFLNDHLNHLKDNLWFYLEYPYVDKVYRDSYYTYFSSKHKDYDRNCVRISIFESHLDYSFFRKPELISNLQEYYLGYLVLRPTSTCPVGRSMISPKAMKNDEVVCCLVKETSLVNGVLFSTTAFPHSSQDQETITCAETTIWSVLEYFGNKYSFYKPVLPSDILAALDKLSPERLIPSNGLKATEISYALKEFGFGSKTYSIGAYSKDELQKILNHYIESGIPVICALQNQNIGHAIIYCGHENIDLSNIDNCQAYKLTRGSKELLIYDTADIEKKYVTIDDNYSPYKTATFNNPTAYYSDPAFYQCQIVSLIVPLYPKIYLEAFKARKLIDLILISDNIGINSDSVLVRFFLTSSRSFKNCINLDSDFDDDYKELIVNSAMPKFVWIAELSSKKLYKQNKAYGFIIIDATGSDSTDSIILIAYSDRLILLKNNKYQVYSRPYCKLYNIYRNNLKGGWNQWQA